MEWNHLLQGLGYSEVQLVVGGLVLVLVRVYGLRQVRDKTGKKAREKGERAEEKTDRLNIKGKRLKPALVFRPCFHFKCSCVQRLIELALILSVSILH